MKVKFDDVTAGMSYLEKWQMMIAPRLRKIAAEEDRPFVEIEMSRAVMQMIEWDNWWGLEKHYRTMLRRTPSFDDWYEDAKTHCAGIGPRDQSLFKVEKEGK